MAMDIDEATFLDMVTVETIDEAAATFATYGIVRIPDFLSADESAALSDAAGECGLRRDAFGQASQLDRFTLWLAGDGMEGSAGAATTAARFEQRAPSAQKAFLDEDGWRSIAAARGYSHLALAEVVTSLPGGEEQRWHFDGMGVTAQIALVPIGDAQGPTEVTPRPLDESFVRASEWVSLAAGLEPAKKIATVLPRLPELASSAPQRPLHDAVTAVHAAAWAALRPLLSALDETNSKRVAEQLVEWGLTPSVVRLTAAVGTLTLYDSSMIHRGGRNVGPTPRPILAVHLRENGLEYGMREDVVAEEAR